MARIKISIKIKGAKRVANKLSNILPSRLNSKIIAGLVESTQEVVTAAIPLTPFKTFDLRRSVRGEVNARTLAAVVIAGSDDVPYAIYQEFGTFENRIDKDDINTIRALVRLGISAKRGKGIAPSLFLHRGVEKSRTRIVKIMERKVNELIQELGLA